MLIFDVNHGIFLHIALTRLVNRTAWTVQSLEVGLGQTLLHLMLFEKRVLPQLPILVALQSFFANQVLLAALRKFAGIIVRFDTLYPLEDFLILFQDLIQLTHAYRMVKCRHNFVSAVVRCRLCR